MAVVDLNLVKLHRSLIVFYCALILQHKLFLVVQQLLLDRVARPCGTVAFNIHLRLCEHVLVALERSLRLQKSSRGTDANRCQPADRLCLRVGLP